jgi:hypothetical protein
MSYRIAATLGFLVLTLVLPACGSSGANDTAPVTPDPERPTFIFFFTDP